MIKKKMQSMNYKNVILKNSHWQKQFSDTMELYMSIDNDSLLYKFRERRGLQAPGQTLMGWYGDGATTFGQIISAFCKMYMVTGDLRIKEKVESLLLEWEKSIENDGYCMLPNQKSIYCFEKIVTGILDAYEYLGYKPALDMLKRISNWANNYYPKDIERDGDHYEYLTSIQMNEWYTLGEAYYRAYLLTGDKDYYSFAEEWEYPFLWKSLSVGNDNLPTRHAYSQVNSLCSAAKAYEVKGDEYYLKAIVNGYDLIYNNHTFVTGGYGPAEAMFGEPGYLGDSLLPARIHSNYNLFKNIEGNPVRDDDWGSCEVPCCSWAVFKLCGYLLKLTGEAKYGHWIEKLMINGMGGQLPITKDGKVMYYANYFCNGAYKTVEDRRIFINGANYEWPCCSGTFPQAVTEYHNILYYYNDCGLFISQYLPNVLNIPNSKSPMLLEVSGNYPFEDTIIFRVHTKNKQKYAFHFRIPQWCKQSYCMVNGVTEEWSITDDGWAKVEREWKDEDVITWKFPFHLYFEPVDPQHPYLLALCYGPLTMVCKQRAILNGDINNPSEWIKPLYGKTLMFETVPGHDKKYNNRTHTFVPYISIGEMEWYYMYFMVNLDESLNEDII